MKRFILFTLIAVLLVSAGALQAIDKLGTGVQPQVRNSVNALIDEAGLPQILGTWFYVDPENGSATNPGTAKDRALLHILAAYNKCTSGDGDGIILLSSGTSSSHTTSYLDSSMAWHKHGITVLGIAAPTRMFGRARISNSSFTAGDVTATHALAYLIDVIGNNNSFLNMHVANYGDSVVAVGCMKVTGNRNYFDNCHFIGGGHATPAAATGMFSLHASGEENTYVNCTFGTDTIIRGAANAEILFDGSCRRAVFEGCRVISYSTTAGHGAIKSADATSIDGWTVFRGCSFTNWNTGDLSALTSAFIGTNPNNLGLLMQDCSLIGWAAWDSVGGNDRVYVVNSAVTASGAGGIATTP